MDREIGEWRYYVNFAAGSFHTKKLCSRLLMVFGRNFCEKRKNGASEPYFREVRGDAPHGLSLIHISEPTRPY